MAHDVTGISAKEALLKLKKGNETYVNAASNPGDISPDIRKDTCENGQFPYAVVVTCSDSRVIPESIFPQESENFLRSALPETLSMIFSWAA